MTQSINKLSENILSNTEKTKNTNNTTNFSDVFKFKLIPEELAKYHNDAQKEYEKYKAKGMTERESMYFWGEYYPNKIDAIEINGKDKWGKWSYEDFKKVFQIFPPVDAPQDVVDTWEKALSNYSPDKVLRIQRKFNLKASRLSDEEYNNVINSIKNGNDLEDIESNINIPLNSLFYYK